MAVNYDQNRQPPEHAESAQEYDIESSRRTRQAFGRV